MENLLRQLKLELGIESSPGGEREEQRKGRRGLVSQLGSSRSSGKVLPPAPPHRKTLQEIKEKERRRQDQKVLDDLSEREIKELLKDASLGIVCHISTEKSSFFSSDSDTVNSILDIMTRDDDVSGSTDSPKLFNNVNISSFNVSFNAGRKERPSSGQIGGRKKMTVLQRRVSERRDSR